jgi:large subunit ribosomal protein L25
MEPSKLVATSRTTSGKGAARRMRRDGLIPATAYGKDMPAQSLAVSPKDVAELLGSEFGRNTVIELAVEGGTSTTVLIRDYQYHPVTRELLHADFRKIDLGQPVQVDVPLVLSGRCKGVVAGGILRQVFRHIRVQCLPTDIPAQIEHDITELDIDETVPASDLALPTGVTIELAPTQTVAAVGAVKETAAEEEEAAAAAAEGEGEKPAAAEGTAEAPSEPEAKPEQ